MLTALIDADTNLPKYYIDNAGYARIKIDGKEILLHRWIVEEVLGKKLKPYEIIHHINYNTLDNRRSNLLVCPNQAYHNLIHARTDMVNKNVNPNTHHICSSCKNVKEKDEFPKNRDEWNGVNHDCKDCSNSRRREKKYSVGKFNWLRRLQQQYRRIKSSCTKREICWITKEGTCL